MQRASSQLPGAQTEADHGQGADVPRAVEQLQAHLPQYEILELLGRGGMGAVYKARQRSLNRMVAIKLLTPGPADDGFQIVERFRKEAQTLAQMSHPAIVGVHDFGEAPDGLLYFVMEFVHGTDIHRLIAGSGKLCADHALAIAAHVCDALAYAHARGVIHRDIKPANILINEEGQVKVADFGLAKMLDGALTRGLTRTDVAMGTVDFAAPEVFRPGTTVDHRADLYAVGAMLYQMLTGHAPRGFFRLPSTTDAGIDPRFDAIVVKALEDDREERYQSALQMRSALDEICATPRLIEAGPSGIAMPKNIERAPSGSSRKKLLIGAALVVVLGMSAFWKLAPPRSQKPVRESPTAAQPAPAAAAEWTDWLSSKLPNDYYFSTEAGWKKEAGGLTTVREMAGEQVLPPGTKDGAIRITYLLCGMKGPNLTIRERGSGAGRELYCAEDTGEILYLFRKDPVTNTLVPLAAKSIPDSISRTTDRTLEFRFVGDTLTATLNGVFSIAAKDNTLAEGLCAFVLTKGVLLKKVEISD